MTHNVLGSRAVWSPDGAHLAFELDNTVDVLPNVYGHQIFERQVSRSGPPPPPPTTTPVLSLAPATDSGTVGGTRTVTAELLDDATGTAVAGAAIGFAVKAGPNTGTAGRCSATPCVTDSTGHVSWTYASNGQLGADTVHAFNDTNGNAKADADEAYDNAEIMWLPPTTSRTTPNWAGYVLTNSSARSLSSQIIVPPIHSPCSQNVYSRFWIGYNGIRDTTYLPQIGIAADCYRPDATGTPACANSRVPNYRLWFELNPHVPSEDICDIHIRPGDKISLTIQTSAADVSLAITLVLPDGTVSDTWFRTFTAGQKVTTGKQTFRLPKKLTYDSLECIAEAPTEAGKAYLPLANFGTVEFNGCSAIDHWTPGATLTRVDMQTKSKAPIRMATTGPISVNARGFSHFEVAWQHQ